MSCAFVLPISYSINYRKNVQQSRKSTGNFEHPTGAPLQFHLYNQFSGHLHVKSKKNKAQGENSQGAYKFTRTLIGKQETKKEKKKRGGRYKEKQREGKRSPDSAKKLGINSMALKIQIHI